MAICLKSTCATMRDATRVTPCVRCIEWTLRCTDDTLPRPSVGRETKGGGSRRLPRNVRNDEMGYEVWVCEGLVVVFLTDNVSQNCRRRRKGRLRQKICEVSNQKKFEVERVVSVYADRRRSSRSIRVQKNSCLDCSQQEFKHTEARGG